MGRWMEGNSEELVPYIEPEPYKAECLSLLRNIGILCSFPYYCSSLAIIIQHMSGNFQFMQRKSKFSGMLLFTVMFCLLS
jgi:hypothetical protein